MSEKAKNPDYTKSAVSLTNSPELKDMLMARRQKVEQYEALVNALHETDEWKAMRESDSSIGHLDDLIKEAMTRLGGFQDIKQGLYALWQRRLTISYIPKQVRAVLPKFADAIIEEVVNKKKMEGLVKGGLVTASQANACAEAEEAVAPVIKT